MSRSDYVDDTDEEDPLASDMLQRQNSCAPGEGGCLYRLAPCGRTV